MVSPEHNKLDVLPIRLDVFVEDQTYHSFGSGDGLVLVKFQTIT